MKLIQQQTIQESLSVSYLIEKISRGEMALFKKNLIEYLSKINPAESEENAKNLVRDFLRDTFYNSKNDINTKGRIDLAIYQREQPVVILETKKPTEKYDPDMLQPGNLKAKAMYQLVLYFLEERIQHNNIKYLIATNMHEWFIFDAAWFDKLFFKHRELVKDYTEWKAKAKVSADRDLFYKEIAKPVVEEVESQLPYTYFDLRDTRNLIQKNSTVADNKLALYFKVFSPRHLLKESARNDSNQLNTEFYNELLHIIGLEEIKDGGKKRIDRKKKASEEGSLLENAINTLKTRGKLHSIENLNQYGELEEDQLFSVALELCITWLNRILFLKLLEGQLITYHRKDPSFAFLSIDKITDFDELNELFFEVLAVPQATRSPSVVKKFGNIPYLNSSLFEASALEDASLRIADLKDRLELRIYSYSVLKDDAGKRLKGNKNTLHYLFEFLNAYDFASEDTENIVVDTKKDVINASVLGLIFEKINGYKDGSFFTPGFITEYMCHETLRRAVAEKFKVAHEASIESFEDVKSYVNKYFKKDDLLRFNQTINSLKICDPAVGSGHFLVSSLNEILGIKSELGILLDTDGQSLEYLVKIENDTLIVSHRGTNEPFNYLLDKDGTPPPALQKVQQALFNEKQIIIEGCLFGVDINPKSVMICRLRLWIELLKHAYYKTSPATKKSESFELQTLPNIDINIKTGNSLVSRFDVKADLGKALRSIKYNINQYRSFVNDYKNASDKETKRGLLKIIEQIKGQFRTEIAKYTNPRVLRLQKLSEELFLKYQGKQLFNSTLTEEQKKKQQKLIDEHEKLSTDLEEVKNSTVFQNAFEWRFEFPEVLDDKGDFIGFDVVIGNPPYIRQEEFSGIKEYLKQSYETYTGTADLFVYFIELGLKRLKENGQFIYIVPNKWMKAGYGKLIRNFIKGHQINNILDFGDLPVFEEATTYPSVLSVTKSKPALDFFSSSVATLNFQEGLLDYTNSIKFKVLVDALNEEGWILSDSKAQLLIQKIKTTGVSLGNYVNHEIYYGIKTALNEAFIITEETKNHLITNDKRSAEIIKPFLAGKDIKSFVSPKVKQWVILFPKGFTIKRNLPVGNPLRISEPTPRYGDMPYDDAWDWLQENYKAIAKHLLPFKKQAEKRTDKGDYWWELRACDYYEAFENAKIVWPETSLDNQFCYVEAGVYLNKTSFFIPKKDDFLLGLLNSSLSKFYLGSIVSKMRGGYFSMSKAYVETLPIAYNKSIAEDIAKTVNRILSVKKKDPTANTSKLEEEIDQLVYTLYKLTKEEIKIVKRV